MSAVRGGGGVAVAAWAAAMRRRRLLIMGRKLPTVQPREFQAAGDRVLVGLWADTMESRPTRWWSVLTVRDGQVVAIEDHARRRDAARALERRPADAAA